MIIGIGYFGETRYCRGNGGFRKFTNGVCVCVAIWALKVKLCALLPVVIVEQACPLPLVFTEDDPTVG